MCSILYETCLRISVVNEVSKRTPREVFQEGVIGAFGITRSRCRRRYFGLWRSFGGTLPRCFWRRGGRQERLYQR
jgi:hypothetical protein